MKKRLGIPVNWLQCVIIGQSTDRYVIVMSYILTLNDILYIIEPSQRSDHLKNLTLFSILIGNEAYPLHFL